MNVLKSKPFHFYVSMEKLHLKSAKLKGNLLKYRHISESVNILCWVHSKHSTCGIKLGKITYRHRKTFEKKFGKMNQIPCINGLYCFDPIILL